MHSLRDLRSGRARRVRMMRTTCVAIAAALLLLPAAARATTLDDLIDPATKPEVIGSGYQFTEGPAGDAEGNCYFSDTRDNTIHFYPLSRQVEVFFKPSPGTNGIMLSRRGELYVCEGKAHRVAVIDPQTKARRVLCSEIDGQPFNEPNDLAVDAEGGCYFSDPYFAGKPPMKEDVYYAAADGHVTRVSTVCRKPNGVLLSADDRTLYVIDIAGKKMYRYEVLGPGKLANETKWIDMQTWGDGMTLDADGNLYVAGEALVVYSPAGKLIGRLPVAGRSSNCAFGGSDFRTLFVTAQDKFLALTMKVVGQKPWPARRAAPADK